MENRWRSHSCDIVAECEQSCLHPEAPHTRFVRGGSPVLPVASARSASLIVPVEHVVKISALGQARRDVDLLHGQSGLGISILAHVQ